MTEQKASAVRVRLQVETLHTQWTDVKAISFLHVEQRFQSDVWASMPGVWRTGPSACKRDRWLDEGKGALDLYFQNESPGADKEANWLPAPKGPFTLTMRMYASRTEALTGKWNPPPVMIVQTVPPLQVQ